MDEPSESPPGFMESARRLRDGLAAMARDRFALAAVEVQEEKYRLIQIFIWISAAIFTGMLMMIFASLAIVYYFWDSSPLGALIGLTLFYCAAVGCIALGFRRLIARQPVLFKDYVEAPAPNPPHARDES
ncbi:MAG: hypothetical protein JWM35_2488 [Verrucomicrobia bacterium]|nr:hypothetical protein [Verrucomicrobiota bacterium]